MYFFISGLWSGVKPEITRRNREMKKLLGLAIIAILAGGAYATNLLLNPGFENWDSGAPEYWSNDDGITVTQNSDTVLSGDYSAKIVLTTQNQSNADFFQEYIPVTGGNMYTAGTSIFDNDSAGKARIVVYWFASDSSYLSGTYGSYSSDSPAWSVVLDTVVAPDGAAYAKFNIRFYDVASFWDGDAEFFLDNAFFLEMGEPAPDTLTIMEIQGQTDTSPYEGQIVVTTGVITGVFGNNFFLEEQPGGAWHGIYVYRGGVSDPAVSVGDSVLVTGTVSEYYGMTEITNLVDLVILSSGAAVPGPILLATNEVNDEAYEAVFVRVDNAQCTNDDLGYGEWEVDDGTGPVRIDDMGVPYTPVLGNLYMVQGPVMYSYSNYKIEPRTETDIVDYGSTDVGEGELKGEVAFKLVTNPARGKAVFQFAPLVSGRVEIILYDLTGKAVRILRKDLKGGSSRVEMDLRGLPGGVYFYSVRASGLTGRGKLSIM